MWFASLLILVSGSKHTMANDFTTRLRRSRDEVLLDDLIAFVIAMVSCGGAR